MAQGDDMSNPTGTAADARSGAEVELEDIADALRDAQKIVLATHENPDGDAIGSVRAMEVALNQLGKDVLVYVPRGVVPREYEFIRPERLIEDVPSDMSERTLLALDCGNASRLANPQLLAQARVVLNVDHHADNTRYGDRNVVRGQVACATQLVWELAEQLGIERNAQFGTAVYVGLVTDTGRFQYSNTDSAAFMLAAELVATGVDTHEVFREVYERMEWRRLKLLGRGLDKARSHNEGAIISAYLTREDFAEAGADEDSAEGIVDFLRGVDDALVAVMVRELQPGSELARKGSLRTTREDVDVSIIARSYAGGGHRQAAGFSTDDSMVQIVQRVREGLREQGIAIPGA